MSFDSQLLEPFAIPNLECKDLYLSRVKSDRRVSCLVISRPLKGNAFTEAMFDTFRGLVEFLEENLDSLGIRALIIVSQGKLFSAGSDISFLQDIYTSARNVDQCPGEMREKLRRGITRVQGSYTALERLRCPVIACIGGACIGGGVDLITAADIRLCNEAASFCVKEVEVGIVADLGSLARLPAIVGQGNALDLCLTANVITADEALRIGLVTRVFQGKDSQSLFLGAIKLAASIADKPKLAVRGTKAMLIRSRSSQVTRDQEAVATWNAAQLISKDLEHILERAHQKMSKL